MIRSVLLAVTIALLALAAGAQEAEPEATPQPAASPTPAPDYSKPALRFIFRDAGDSTTPPETPGLAYERFGWIFRWVPITDGSTNDGAYGSASALPTIDPFHMLGVSFPATARTAPSPLDGVPRSFSERRYRRQMLSVTRRANESENNR
ncbi:MAG TPA: hypothetical protein VMS12_12560 [Thermoanaerobaculia bacterium]|nr:hypothetical protein [Thermoanaerobaculia bacterium]